MSSTQKAPEAPEQDKTEAPVEVPAKLRQVEPESKYAVENWDFDFDALNAIVAKAPLSIKKPIRVWESMATKSVGSYRFREAEGYHAVYASRKVDAKAASDELYVQLVKAAANERKLDEDATKKLGEQVEKLAKRPALTQPLPTPDSK